MNSSGLIRNLIFFVLVMSLTACGGSSGGSTSSSSTSKNNPPPSTTPPTAPSAPTGLTASAGNAQVVLSWTAATGVTSYNVKRSTTSGGPYTNVQTGIMGTSYTNTGLTNGTTYYFVVSATNTFGESGNSSQVSAKPVAPTQVPSVPTGVTATPSNAQVFLGWNAVSGATGYKIYRGTNVIGSPTSNNFTDTGLTNGTAYTYQVSATNSVGEGTKSSSVSATPQAPTSGASFPARWSVGAPGVGRYDWRDARLPVPSGYTLVEGNAADGYAINYYACGNVVLDHVYLRGFLYLGTGCYGHVTITNSIIAPPVGSGQRPILANSDGQQPLTITITNSTIRPEPVVSGQTNAPLVEHALNGCVNCSIVMDRVDVANTGGMCECSDNVTITNSWLHDNWVPLTNPELAHTGGVFPYGGSGPLIVRNNRLEPGVDATTGQEHVDYWKPITAVLFTQGGAMTNGYIIEGNFISLGSFDVAFEIGNGLIVRNNVLGPNHFGYASNTGATFAEWTNNVQGNIDGTSTSVMIPRP